MGLCSYSWRVPVTAFGKLKLVASSPIGDLGPVEGEPVFVDWPFARNVPGLLLRAAGVGAAAFVFFLWRRWNSRRRSRPAPMKER
jgi:hypothetical protein